MAYQLFLRTDSNSFIHLDGAGVVAPVKGCRYAPGSGTAAGVVAGARSAARGMDERGRQVIAEELVVELAGSYRQISNWISALLAEVNLWQAGAWRKPGLSGPWLCIQEPDEADAAKYWHSAILSMDVTIDAAGLAQRALGRQLVRVRFTREDRWTYTIPPGFDITLGDGATLFSTQGYLLNHYDSSAGHCNWGYLPAANVTGDLDAGDALFVGTTKSGRSLGDIYIGCGWTDDSNPAARQFVNTLQETAFTAGSGVGKTSYASATCAGGNYAGFAWNTAGVVLLASAAIPIALYAGRYSNGRPFKPMGRLQNGLAVTDLWLKAKIIVTSTGAVLYETEWINYSSGSPLIELPPVFIPPDGVVEGTGLDFALYAMRSSTTAYVLDIDFFQLWPVDGGFRKLKALAYGLGSGRVYDENVRGRVYWTPLINAERSVYYGVGAPIRLFPGRTNVLALLNIAGGNSWLIDDELSLWVNLSPVKRDL